LRAAAAPLILTVIEIDGQRPEEWVAPVDVQTDIDIARPVATVADFATDPVHAPEWYANIVAAAWRTEPPVRVGSVFAFVARFLGRTLAYDYEVVEHRPGERFVMRTIRGPFPMETTYTWTVRGDGTHMTLRNRGEPTGFSRAVAPFMTPAIRRANRKDLATLKTILERRAPNDE
jgi:hypothetical protein